jgi:hypothetical protein
MDITCKSCGTTLKIPDEKLPPGQTVNITCPKCKGKIRIDTRELDRGIVSKKKEEIEEDTGPLDLIGEGIKLALVLNGDDGQVMEINSVLEELSYKSIVSPSVQDAMGKLRLHHFDLIMLSDGFDGQDIENSPITHYLNHLSMSIRRKTFLALLSDKFKTLDNMMAFGKSANLVVNPDDISNLALILKKAVSDNEKFYKVFMDTLKEVGKE